jgi:hypothetical protein
MTDPTTCENWAGTLDSEGYGRITRNGRGLRAHRVAWETEYGPIPDGLMVLHHCDNRRCVRLDHLYLRTQIQNMRDRAERHPGWAGHRRHSAEELVQLLESTGSIRLAAEQIGVSSRTLSRWLTHYGIRAVVRYEYEAAEAA